MRRAPHPDSDFGKAMGTGKLQQEYDLKNPQVHIYSRYTSDTRGRAEKVLTEVLGGHTVTYGSG